MPHRRRTGRRRADTLDYDQETELELGPSGATSSAFASPLERRFAWFRHREELLDDSAEGKRPWGWWQYEAPAPKRVLERRVVHDPDNPAQPAIVVSGDGFASHTRHDGIVEVRASDEQFLERHGLLTGSERGLLAFRRRIVAESARTPKSKAKV